MTERKKTELLIPAADLKSLKEAVLAGADAVLVDGNIMGPGLHSFDMKTIKEGAAFAHEQGAKIYVTTADAPHNDELRPALKNLLLLKNAAPDALVITDPGLFSMAKEVMPETRLHIDGPVSSNYGSFLFWHSQGAARASAANDLFPAELAEIKASIPEEMEIEAAIICGPGEGTGENGISDKLEDLLDGGLDCLKLNCRPESEAGAASLTRAYRQAIDAYYEKRS